MTLTDRPLSGLLAVSIEQAVAAPICSMRLADAGARVLKIEPLGGETARHYDSAVLGHSAYFASLNRGKESVCLNLHAKNDFGLLNRILKKADIFIRNTKPGAMARLDLDAQTLLLQYPSLITVDIVGYGQDTPYKDMKAYDLLVQAESGLCAVTGSNGEPAKVGVSIADMGTGLNAYAAVLEALHQRTKTAQGAAIEISMFDSVAEWMSVPLLHFEHAGTVAGLHGMAHASIYPYRPYKCRDGEVVIAVQNADQWTKFCAIVILQPELEKDPRFHDNASRVANRIALDTFISAAVCGLDRFEFIRRIEKAGIAYGQLNTLKNLSSHSALRRKTILSGNDSLQVVASPMPSANNTDCALPSIGEHIFSVSEEFSEKL